MQIGLAHRRGGGNTVSRMTVPLDMSAELLLSAYSAGIFPMGSEDESDTLYWVDPPKRGILPLDGLHVSRSLRKRIRRGGFDVRVDEDFVGTMRDCADRGETWINNAILQIYTDLHERGFAHSIEVWSGGQRIGGLYGVSLGAGFFGESMFHRETDASKIALVWLVARLRAGGFTLLDTQFSTSHLASLGVVEIPRKTYRDRLARALGRPAHFHAFETEADCETVLAAAKADF